MPAIRLIAVGQRTAGDDGIGPAVLDEARRRGVPPEVELITVADASSLTDLLSTAHPVVIVDAARGGTPGQVREVDAGALAHGSLYLSSHGISVADALALTRRLAPDAIAPSIRIVAVTIDSARRFDLELSPPVAAAVERAAGLVLDLIRTTLDRT